VTKEGPVDIELFTRFVDGWGPVQDSIVAVTSGVVQDATDLDAVLVPVLDDLLSIISVSANVSVGSFRVDSKGRSQESSVVTVDESGEFRRLNEVATGAILERIAAHTCSVELWKVASSYRSALNHWNTLDQSVAISHLHCGCLTMVDVLTRYLCESRGLSERELADSLKVVQNNLPSYVLETELYRDDVACLRAAEAAVSRVDEDRGQALEEYSYIPDDAELAIARYLRSAIIRVAELEEPHRITLLSSPYDLPLVGNPASASHTARASFSTSQRAGIRARALNQFE
jgi:hypothetical protein